MKLIMENWCRYLNEDEVKTSSSEELVKFIIRSNEIEEYNLDLAQVKEAVEEYNNGVSLSYIRTWEPDHKHIVAHLAGIETAKKGVNSVGDVTRIHGAMGADVLDAGMPGVLRSGTEAQSVGGTKYVSSKDVPRALTWWVQQNWSVPFEAHTVYEIIHPFSDGNGRSGRIILAAMLNFNFATVNNLIDKSY